MATVACPFCYHRISQSRLAYICRGRGALGSKVRCTKSVDEERNRITSVRATSYPWFDLPARGMSHPREAPCPHCGGLTGVRACPVCHSPLSSTFAESRTPMIGIVGGKGAGKTVYTAVLHHQLRGPVRKRFQADIRLSGDQQGGAGSPQQWLERNDQRLFDDGKLFDPTAQSDGMRQPVVIEWRQPRRSFGRETFHTTVLSFYDTAGEDLTSQESVHAQAYLGVAEGLILLLDPWQLPGARDRIEVPDAVITGAVPPLVVLAMITELLRTEHKVREKKRIKVPLAVVFAKMDAFYSVLGPHHPLLSAPAPAPGYDEPAGQATHEQVMAMLQEHGADDIEAHLHANYETHRYFAVSALGAPPDYANGTVPNAVQPLRVEEPLLWLLNRFDVIDRSSS
jgi:hypothetical protein